MTSPAGKRFRPVSILRLAAGLSVAATLLSACGGGSTSQAAASAGADCESTTSSSLLVQTADLDVSYVPYGILADELGYYADECIDMDVEVTSDSTISPLLNGKTDFAISAPSEVLTAGDGEAMGAKIVYNMIPKLNIFLAVLPDSSITSVADLKGATIGISNSSTYYDAFMQESLEAQGLSLDDITYVTTGYGSTPLNALKNGDVDAVLYWPGIYAAWANSGLDVRLLEGTDWSEDMDGLGMAAADETISDDPELVEGVSRAISRAIVYAKRYPESVVKLFWDAYPERAPLPGDDEDAALEEDVALLNATLTSMDVDQHEEDYTWGVQTSERWQNTIDFYQGSGMIDDSVTVDADDFYTNEFNDAANDFDLDSIVEQQ